jgi:hypothetical protein
MSLRISDLVLDKTRPTYRKLEQENRRRPERAAFNGETLNQRI